MLEMITTPIIDFGNGFTINLSRERWQTQCFRAAIAASSGGGKSHLTAVLCEELAGLGIPFLAIDPDEEYTSLNQLSNVLVAAFEDGDIALSQTRGKWIDEVLQQIDQGNSVVIDLGPLAGQKSEQRLVYASLLRKLWDAQQVKRKAGDVSPLFLVIEEAHVFAPQKRQSDPEALEITVDIAQRGRKYGINSVFVTQRPSALEKDILSQANLRFIGKLEMDNDFEAVKSLLPKGTKHEQLLSLNTGEFFLRIGPDFHKLQPVRARKTKDLARTPALAYRQRAMFEAVEVGR